MNNTIHRTVKLLDRDTANEVLQQLLTGDCATVETIRKAFGRKRQGFGTHPDNSRGYQLRLAREQLN